MANNEELGNIIDELARIETAIEELSIIKDFEGAIPKLYNDLGKVIDGLNKEYINNGGKWWTIIWLWF